ncbi:histidine kinase,Response regulator receiver domain protein,histidine kinase [Bernardetia litoralis DSM 6794]|uniref:histidine kinase n=1 Tax=Bernardetia litoralis (strain ATCC 23117 / DSM 6794 / NBRC 15988 / NCIMB 1366 / Fx l1 / Sio-4) TaxID=880071 RepID=I4AFT7_BERLS|nr:response regulator [Bernardetia litoralis]AFM02822.1 histidine kinase,Response regulator receiver domain protein,histidine kinase [Bernardetia litoralis DSM 6794]
MSEQLSRIQVLIVDDVPSNLFTLRALLEEHFEEIEIVEANSGIEALEVLMRESIDLIILDIQMPEMDGFQTAKLIRSRKKTRNIPIVFLTAAYKSEEFKEKGFSLGATDYLTKPIDDYQLTSRINAYLSIIKLEKNHKSELERRVEERTSELKKALSQIKETNLKLETTLSKLKNAQKQVIAQEKLASLGELTAGIAHEIKNPLNFIINFSELSKEMIIELNDTFADVGKDIVEGSLKDITPDDVDNIKDILQNLNENSEKIHEHGKRADSIINNMLMHSQDRKGVYQDTHINTMLQEYISLAYHSTINNYKGFAAKIETNLDANVGNVKIIPQDLGRVFLNVVSNSLYALYNKKRKLGDGFEPMLTVRTINHEDNVEIIFRDNGTGIPQEMMDKIFNPFFTTKPAGEGTGLGLSICYDIVRNIHKGEIQVDSKEGEYTDFSIFLPKHVDTEENENGEENASYQNR